MHLTLSEARTHGEGLAVVSTSLHPLSPWVVSLTYFCNVQLVTTLSAILHYYVYFTLGLVAGETLSQPTRRIID